MAYLKPQPLNFYRTKLLERRDFGVSPQPLGFAMLWTETPPKSQISLANACALEDERQPRVNALAEIAELKTRTSFDRIYTNPCYRQGRSLNPYATGLPRVSSFA